MARTHSIKVVNIKGDRPTVEDARRRLIDEIRAAKAGGVRVLKVVHGYGSSGRGGALRAALRKSLIRRRKEGLVLEIIYGEKWTIFDARAQTLIERFPALRGDPDLNNSNEGVTLIVL